MLILLLFFIGSINFGQEYPVKNYTEDDGLPNSEVNDLIQDNDGLLWIATEGGIAGYNGTEWRYPSQFFPNLDGVFNLLRSDGKDIWAFRYDSKMELVRIRDGKLLSFLPPYMISSDQIPVNFEIADGTGEMNVLFGTRNSGLYHFRDNEIFKYGKGEGLRSLKIFKIIKSKYHYYIATENGIYKLAFNGSRPEEIDQIPEAYKSVLSICFREGEKDSSLWLLGKNYIGEIRNNNFRPVTDNFIIQHDTYYNFNIPFIADYFGKFIFSNNNRLYIFDPIKESLSFLNEENGIINGQARSLYTDRENNLWIAGVRGLSKINNLKTFSYYKKNGLLIDEVSAIVRMSDNGLMLGHNTGLTIMKNGNFRRIPFYEANNYQLPKATRVLDLCALPNGNIWISAEEKGFGLFHDGEIVKWLNVKDDYAASAVYDSDNDILYAQNNYNIYKIINDKLVFLTGSQSHTTKFRKLFLSPENVLHTATTNNGILKISSDGEWQFFRSSNQNANQTWAVYFYNGQTFAGTAAGLFEINGDSLKYYDKDGFSINRTIYFITGDNRGKLWFGTDQGVIYLDGNKSFHYNTSNGLAGSETNRDAAYIDDRQRLWVGTNRGLSVIDAGVETNELKPSIDFVAVDVDGKELELKDDITLAHSQNTLLFKFRSHSFINEAKNIYYVKLEGFDEEWITVQGKIGPSIRYTNLMPGKYRFRVQVKNAYGIMSDIKDTAVVKINESILSSWWLRLLVIAAIGGTFYLLFLYIHNRNYSRELEKRVAERTKAFELSESRYKNLFYGHSAPMMLLDLGTFNIIEINDAALNFYGYNREEFLGKNIYEIDASENKPNRQSVGEATRFETRHNLKDGSVRDVEIFYSVLEIEGKKIFSSIIHDITERKAIARAVRESEENYRSLAGNIQDGLLLIQGQKFIFVNEAMASMLGYTAEEMLGTSFDSYIHPDDREKVIYRYRARLHGKKPESEYEIKLLHKNGSLVFTYLNVGLTNYNGKQATIGTLKDITIKKNQEEELKILSTAIEENPQGILILETDMVIRYSNPVFFEYTGFSEDELKGKNFESLIDLQTSRISFDSVKKSIIKENGWKGELYFRKKDRSNFWGMVGTSIIKNDSGKVQNIVITAEDITFDKELFQQIRDNERFLNSILTNLPVIVFLLNKEGKFTLVKGKGLEEAGVEQNSYTGHSAFKIYKNYPEIIDDFQRALKGESFKTIRRIKSEIFEISFVPFLDSQGDFEETLGISSNITKRYESEQAVIKSESRHRALLEAIPDLIFEISVDGVFLTCKYSHESVLLLPPKDFLGKKITEVLPDELAQLTMRLIQRTKETGKIQVYEYSLDIDGGKRYYESRLKLSEKNSVLSIVRDITEKKNSERELLIAKEEAERSDRLKSEFLAQISHEIRTPLNSILSFTQLIRDLVSEIMDDDLEESFAAINSGGRRLTRTIDLILNMSQIQTDSYKPHYTTLCLNKDILSQIIDEFKPVADSKKISLQYSPESQSAVVMGDRYTLSQIFTNLIDNAIKYTPEGKVGVIISEDDNRVIVKVTDTGIGISEEFIPDLFQPFSQEETGYTRRFEGNGLGLALVQKYVEINNAAITVDSIKGSGSTFSVSFSKTHKI